MPDPKWSRPYERFCDRTHSHAALLDVLRRRAMLPADPLTMPEAIRLIFNAMETYRVELYQILEAYHYTPHERDDA